MAKRNQGGMGDEQCACLDRVIARTQELLTLAKQCSDCGYDVTAAIQALNEQLDTARKAKSTFFPNRT